MDDLDIVRLFEARLAKMIAEVERDIKAAGSRQDDDKPDPETGQTKEQLAHMGWPLTGDAEPYDNPPEKLSG